MTKSLAAAFLLVQQQNDPSSHQCDSIISSCTHSLDLYYIQMIEDAPATFMFYALILADVQGLSLLFLLCRSIVIAASPSRCCI